MNVNIDLKEVPQKALHILGKLKKYSGFAFVILVLGAYSFIVFQIQQTINSEPTQTEITDKLLDLNKTRLDEEAIEKIQDLRDTNIEVQTLFQEARDNPFQE